MEKRSAIYFVAAFFLLLCVSTDAARVNKICLSETREDICGYGYFTCLDGTCIERNKYCNNYNDCPDQSDEQYCNGFRSCPELKKYRFSRCESSGKCIPMNWVCDGNADCPGNTDESECDENYDVESADIYRASLSAVRWMKTEIQEKSSTEKWGKLVDKSAVALYLADSDSDFISPDSAIRKELAYELSIQLLSRLALGQLKNVSSSDMASYINALLVTCLNPRDFHGINLVQELRTRVDSSNYTSPYLLLALCNAGDTITETDIKKLVDAFWSKHLEFWKEIQAFAVMAMVCAGKQTEKGVNSEMMSEFTMELKQHQYRNGTVENLQTTALVLQALYAAKSDANPDSFSESKALQQILSHQQTDGSFGNIMKTYYVLPILRCKSLIDISTKHCERASRDENSALQWLVNQPGSKMRIHCSLWIGPQRDTEKTLTLRVPVNTSFYGIMEIAANIDSRYKSEYTMKNKKPYINGVSGILNNAEREKFWFLYLLQDGQPVLIEKSPADIISKENDHFVLWYRQGPWTEK